ncbi:unnamed protein product, partial [Allacma fusca]
MAKEISANEITLSDLYALMTENQRKMEERQQKLEETVLESSSDLAKKIEDSTVALMKRIETVEEEQL